MTHIEMLFHLCRNSCKPPFPDQTERHTNCSLEMLLWLPFQLLFLFHIVSPSLIFSPGWMHTVLLFYYWVELEHPPTIAWPLILSVKRPGSSYSTRQPHHPLESLNVVLENFEINRIDYEAPRTIPTWSLKAFNSAVSSLCARYATLE